MVGAGCNDQPAHTHNPASAGAADKEAKIRQALDKLSPEDRKLAEAQKYCVVEEENRLGSMKTPVKVMVKDQPVFLCCEGCKKEALKDPDKTLARVKELREKNAPKPGP
jgi:hypothetical protein